MWRTVTTFLICLGLGLGLVASQPAPVVSPQSPAPRVVHVVAERFLFSPSEITVEEGTTIEIRLTSEDTNHGFRLTGPGDQRINLTVPRRGRGEAVATFEATTPGDYAFECSHVCGAGHNMMRGRIRVRPRPATASQVEVAR